ncbi:collagen binding domain-containing protein [Streptomyces sp. WAC05950]|uniref:MSCRAMM family protein n=1 Tax=Streptomyces sp. WAC05950 TaxID=2487419 RepID=UPI000F7493C8|nr:SpaA isopeptide-forming pilin-related protein [Streptomyces sp. WAC05950]RST03773.1 LPXTG cell wall anchor domain-containing protein [Streptomyces sp. WAC05950]
MKHRPLLFTALALTAAVLASPATTATAAPSPSAEALKAQGDPAPADKAGLRIVKTDPEGQPAPGAAFQLLDSAGKTLAEGKTGSDGNLAFSDLAPGVVRLKETASGSPLLGTVPDQDVVVTLGEPEVLAITAPYKSAGLTLKVTDKATGKGLAGAIVNIAPKDAKDDKGAFTLTTGPDGTAKAPLPVGRKTGSAYTATETKAPDGYRLETTPVEITAKPGAETTAVSMNAATTKPTEEPTGKPTAKPTGDPTAQPTSTSSSSTGTGEPTDVAFPSSSTGMGTDTSTPTAPDAKPEGSLAHTGADSTNGWLLAIGGLLLAAGGGAVYAARRRKNEESETGTGQHRRTDDN